MHFKGKRNAGDEDLLQLLAANEVIQTLVFNNYNYELYQYDCKHPRMMYFLDNPNLKHSFRQLVSVKSLQSL